MISIYICIGIDTYVQPFSSVHYLHMYNAYTLRALFELSQIGDKETPD